MSPIVAPSILPVVYLFFPLVFGVFILIVLDSSTATSIAMMIAWLTEADSLAHRGVQVPNFVILVEHVKTIV